MTTNTPSPKVPVYEVRLVQSRRLLRLAESRLATPATSAHALHALIGKTDREHLAVLFLSATLDITGAHIAAIGGQHILAAVDSRTLLRAALAACAAGIVLGHSHPSGDPTPSDDDITTTAALMRAANTLSILIVDHVIVTHHERRYHSMLEHGTLPSPDR